MQTDAQGSTTALVDASGAVVRRFLYSSFGAVEQRDAGFDFTGSDISFNYLHAGQRYDPTVQLYANPDGSAFDSVGEKSLVEDPHRYAAERNVGMPGFWSVFGAQVLTRTLGGMQALGGAAEWQLGLQRSGADGVQFRSFTAQTRRGQECGRWVPARRQSRSHSKPSLGPDARRA